MNKGDSLRQYGASLQNCTACGLCLPVCPIYKLTGVEDDGPRGKVAVAFALAQGRLEPKDALPAITRCLLCGQCQGVCPCQLPLQKIFLACRAEIAKILPLTRCQAALFKTLAASPKLLAFLQPPLSLGQKLPFPRKLAARVQTLPALPLQAFSLKPEAYAEPIKKKRILLFTGCITRHFFPNLAMACVKALRKLNYEVVAPADLVCCGRPLALQGKSILMALRKNIAILARESFSYLTSPCPGCLATLQNIWPDAAGLEQEEEKQIASLWPKIIDINQLLAQSLASGSEQAWQQQGKNVFWHKPCLMAAESEGSALRLLTSRKNIKLTPGPENGACCGAPLACLSNLSTPKKRQNYLERLQKPKETALKILLAKKISQNAWKADLLATGCPGCMLALSKGHLPVRHSVEIFLSGLK